MREISGVETDLISRYRKISERLRQNGASLVPAQASEGSAQAATAAQSVQPSSAATPLSNDVTAFLVARQAADEEVSTDDTTDTTPDATVDPVVVDPTPETPTTPVVTQAPSEDPNAQLFAYLDVNGDGTLTKTDFESVIGRVGGPTEVGDMLFNRLDANRTGSVTLDQFDPLRLTPRISVYGDDVQNQVNGQPTVPTQVDPVTPDPVIPDPITPDPVIPAPETPTPTATAEDGISAILNGIAAADADAAATQFQRNIFSQLDLDADGSLTRAELAQAVTCAGGTAEAAGALCSVMDPEGTGAITTQQFIANFHLPEFNIETGFGTVSPADSAVLALMQSAGPATATPQAQTTVNPFSQFDTDGDGALTQADLEKAVTAVGGTAESARALYAQVDPDNVGSVTLQQFVTRMPSPVIDFFGDGGIVASPAWDAMTSLYQSIGAANDPTLLYKQNLFARLDANKSGTLTTAEVSQAVAAGGGSTQSADALVAMLDPNKTGNITMQQFTENLRDLAVNPQGVATVTAAAAPAIPTITAQTTAATEEPAAAASSFSPSMMSVLLQLQSA